MLKDLYDRFYGRWNLKINIKKCLSEINSQGNTNKSIFKSVMRNLHNDYNVKMIGELEGSVWRNIPDFFRLFPNGKAILLVRDLRDIVVSFKKITFAPGNDYLVSIFNVIDKTYTRDLFGEN